MRNDAIEKATRKALGRAGVELVKVVISPERTPPYDDAYVSGLVAKCNNCGEVWRVEEVDDTTFLPKDFFHCPKGCNSNILFEQLFRDD